MRTMRGMRFVAVLLPLALGAACDDEPTGPADSLTVSLQPATAEVARGATQVVNVTVTGPTAFAETATIAAAQLPTGVTAPISDVQRSGNVTTAKATLTVGASAALATTQLKVNATGTGVTAGSATFSLTVKAAP